MELIRILASRFAGLFRSGKLDRELQEELEFHIDMQTEENIRKGMSPEEARRSARALAEESPKSKMNAAIDADSLLSAIRFRISGSARAFFCGIRFSLSLP